MKAVLGKALCKILERQGWEMKRITRSHHIYVKESVDVILSIPVHSNRDLPIGTLKSIMKSCPNIKSPHIFVDAGGIIKQPTTWIIDQAHFKTIQKLCY